MRPGFDLGLGFVLPAFPCLTFAVVGARSSCGRRTGAAGLALGVCTAWLFGHAMVIPSFDMRFSVRKAAADGARVRQVWPWACALPGFWARDGDTQLDRHLTQMHFP